VTAEGTSLQDSSGETTIDDIQKLISGSFCMGK